MPSTQLRLLPAAQPLPGRLGLAFFRSAPRSPGVYRMFDASGRLVYIGKAKDLRARLSSYRRTHGQSRKTIRLIHATCRIEWEVCADDTSARLLENALIRTLRPRFNRAGTWPRSARFLMVEERAGGFRLWLAADPSGESYGAFRAGTGFAVAALARLLWPALHGWTSAFHLPQRLLASDTLRSFTLSHPGAAAWLAPLRQFLAGHDDGLLADLVGAIPEPTAGFDRLFVAAQFELLGEFFRRGPRRNRGLQSDAPEVRVLGAEELDDLLIRRGVSHPAPAFRPPLQPPPAGDAEGRG